MQIQLSHRGSDYTADLSQPLPIAIALGQVRCFYAPAFTITPYQSGDFIGSVKAGSPVNFYNVALNPHGNGTHTECIGHITEAHQSVNRELRQFHFICKLVSIPLQTLKDGDQIVSREQLRKTTGESLPAALIIRTLPNGEHKLHQDYSGTNPPYLEATAMEDLVRLGVKHLLIDLPSVDKERDGGLLKAHRIFWQTAGKARMDCTITELIYVPDAVTDGLYLLNLQIAPLDLDATPSKPVLYKLKKAKSNKNVSRK